MGLLIDILLTLVCAIGLAFLAWWLFGRLLRPIPEQQARVLIPGRGEGENLEQTVRTFIWLRGLGLMNCPIVIADVDLTPDGWELALRLTVRWPDVVLWPVNHLADYITKI
ncbi:MAG: hypothetical protein VB071_13205 [Lawsonibacter sp.]|nr:hypothetical protein [Lawsonibacter sp.]